MTKQERQVHTAGKKLASALLGIEGYDGEPNDLLVEAEFYLRLSSKQNQGAFDAIKALREYYNGGE